MRSPEEINKPTKRIVVTRPNIPVLLQNWQRDSFTGMGKKSRLKRERRKDELAAELGLELKIALEAQIQSFREKFGREPGPGDPLFFDSESDTPQPISSKEMDEISQRINQAMGAAGVDPALIYATQKTGRITPPSEPAYDAMSPEEKAEWHAAIDEYETVAVSASKRRQ
jgi:hypothetical protein